MRMRNHLSISMWTRLGHCEIQGLEKREGAGVRVNLVSRKRRGIMRNSQELRAIRAGIKDRVDWSSKCRHPLDKFKGAGAFVHFVGIDRSVGDYDSLIEAEQVLVFSIKVKP